MCDQQSLRSACAYAQSDQSLCLSLEYSMSVKLLTEHHLQFLSLTGSCTGSSKSTPVKLPHCWKSHVAAQLCMELNYLNSVERGPSKDITPVKFGERFSICCLKHIVDRQTDDDDDGHQRITLNAHLSPWFS